MRMNARQAGGGKRSTADRLMCYANLVFVLFSQRFLHCSFCTLRVWVCVCLAFDHIQHGETGNEMRCPPCSQLVAKPALVSPALTECPWQRALNCLFISTRGTHQARESNKIFTPTNTHTNTHTDTPRWPTKLRRAHTHKLNKGKKQSAVTKFPTRATKLAARACRVWERDKRGCMRATEQERRKRRRNVTPASTPNRIFLLPRVAYFHAACRFR